MEVGTLHRYTCQLWLVMSGLLIMYSVSCAHVPNTFTDPRDGKTYKTVTIGSQIWMAENLNFESPDSWCYADSASYGVTYGRLYTWEEARKVAPPGWHLPSDEEWKTLEIYLGMTEEETEITLLRGDGQGTKLKSEDGWEVENGKLAGYNETGFNGLPGGFRLWDGTYIDMGKRGSWWSSTPFDIYAVRRTLFLNESGIDRDPATRTLGFSIRCVKD